MSVCVSYGVGQRQGGRVGRIFKAPSLPRGVPPMSPESQRKHGTGTLSLRVLHQPLPGICYNFEYITLESQNFL